MKNKFGIYDKSYHLLLETLTLFPAIEKAVIFGSRAIGNYKKGSDVDLAVFGKKVDVKTILQLSMVLNHEQPIPYFFDVVDFNTIDNKELKKHIVVKGIVVYNP